jgi:hypothetical protein
MWPSWSGARAIEIDASSVTSCAPKRSSASASPRPMIELAGHPLAPAASSLAAEQTARPSPLSANPRFSGYRTSTSVSADGIWPAGARIWRLRPTVVGAPSRYGVNEAPSVTDWVAPAVVAAYKQMKTVASAPSRATRTDWPALATHDVSR